MKSLLLALVVCTVVCPTLSHAQPSLKNGVFEANTFTSIDTAVSSGWEMYSQRNEIRPRFFISDYPNLGGKGCLGISGNSNGSKNGCWQTLISNISEGLYYRFDASYTSQNVAFPHYQVLALLDCHDGSDKHVGQPEFVPVGVRSGDWQKVDGVFNAPEGVAAVCTQLFLRFCDQGTVWWDDIKLEQVSAPPKRIVRVGTVNCYLRDNSPSMESVDEFCRVADEAGDKGCDIACLGEGVNLVGVKGAAYADIAVPIPGSTTEKLGEVAK
ncbi:MAG: hypothetical protein JXB48_24600 [Candidatus Latescibacteria bacterium]|nr:hypothetical protein [Candidatus Latescibacterota bacterium]